MRLGAVFTERNANTTAEQTLPLSVTKRGTVEQQAHVAKSRDGAPKKRVERGDLVINSRSDRKGSAGLAHRAGSVSLINIVLTPVGIQPQFAHHLLRSTAFQEEFFRHGSGIVDDLWTTRFSAMKSIQLPVPPQREQRVIADHLDHETAEIDAFISDQIALIELLKARRRSTVDSLVLASGSTPTPLKHLGRLRSGITLGAKYDQETQVYPYLRVANVQTDRVDLTDIAMAEVPKHVAETNRLFAGDVLMTEGGDRDKLGRGALWNGEVETMLHQNHVFAFRPNAGISAAYLVYVLESSAARYYFDVTAKQSTNLASTNSTLVKNFRVPLWAIEKQGEIVASLDAECAALREAVRDAEKIIELSQERRAALISAAVTGQIDVTQRRRPVAEQLEEEVLQDA